MSRVEFYFNLDLFILLMYIPILKQVHVIRTYISYCLIFKVSFVCIALALAIISSIADVWSHDVCNT